MTKTTYPQALRSLADFLDAHGEELNLGTKADQISINPSGRDLNIHVGIFVRDAIEQKAAVRKITRALGGTWEKKPNGSDFYFKQSGIFGYFDATIYADRDAVCERKLVGTEEVVHPAQEATEERTETVPVYEWECGSLLAPDRVDEVVGA